MIHQSIKKDLTSPALVSTSKTELENCPTCGEPIGKIVHMLGKNYIVPRACKCKREEQEKLNKIGKLRERQMKLDSMFKNSLMTKEFRKITFNVWDHNKGSEHMYKLGIKYIRDFSRALKENIGLLIYGVPGNGKTYLSSCIANELLSKSIPVVCVSSIGLLDRIKESFNKYGDEGTQSILKCLDNADLVIIDDLGVEVNTEWSRATIYQILNSRYEKKKPLIITTNLTLEQLKKRYDQDCQGWEKGQGRTFDRFVNEMCQPIENSKPSIRIQNGKEKAAILNEILNK